MDYPSSASYGDKFYSRVSKLVYEFTTPRRFSPMEGVTLKLLNDGQIYARHGKLPVDVDNLGKAGQVVKKLLLTGLVTEVYILKRSMQITVKGAPSWMRMVPLVFAELGYVAPPADTAVIEATSARNLNYMGNQYVQVLLPTGAVFQKVAQRPVNA